MHLPLTIKEHFFNDSPKLSIWMLLEYQAHFRYTLRVVIAIKPMPWAKRASLYNHNRYSYCIWIFWPIFAQQVGPILAQLCPILAHFVTGVGSRNLTMVITFRNVLWAKVSGFYFSKLAVWARFGPDLAKVWPRFGPNYVHMTHFVTGVGSSNLIYALTVAITFRNVLWVEVSGFYFTNWLFGPDLAQTWPKFGPICFI